MAVAVFLPMTYAYDLNMALYLLLGLYVGGISGGLVPANLNHIPGTPSSITEPPLMVIRWQNAARAKEP